MAELITINDSNWQDYADAVHVGPDGLPRAKGLIPRNWQTHPQGCLASAPSFDLEIIPESEWPRLIAQQDANNSSLQHIRRRGNAGLPIPSRDQNGKGYCWAHSGTSAALLARASNNLPYEDLSAYAVACMIKNFRDEGGNGIDGIEFMTQKGLPTSKTWPQQSMSRSNDNAATWAEAAKYKVTKFLDCSQDPALRRMQVATALLLNYPVIGDYDWWSHSVCPMKLLSSSSGLIWNSWGDSWSDMGEGKLEGSKWWPDAAWVLVTEEASP